MDILEPQKDIENNNLFQALFHQSGCIKLIIDLATGKIEAANQSACKFYKYTEQELVNVSFEQVSGLPLQEIKLKLQSSNNYHTTTYQHRNSKQKQLTFSFEKVSFNHKELVSIEIRDYTKNEIAIEPLAENSEHSNESTLLLKKRVKILNAFYSLGQFTESHENFDTICNKIVNNIVPLSMQFPDKAIVLLEIENKKYCNFNEQLFLQEKSFLEAPVFVFNKQLGSLKIAYIDNTPFIDVYEHKLISVFAERISRIIESITSKLVLDESEGRVVENALKFKALTDNSFDIMSVLDKDGTFLFENKAVKRILGYNPGDKIGKKMLEFVHGDDIQKVKECLGEVVSKHKASSIFEYRYKHSNGTWRWLETSAQNFLTNPYIEGVIINSRDITDRKDAEQALKESEEKYKTLVQNQGEGIGITNEDEIFTYANSAAERIFGVKQGGLVNQSLTKFLTEEDTAFIKNETKERLKGRKTTYEIDIIQPTGNIVSLLVTVTPKLDREGNYIGAFGIFRDITQRKAAEKALIESEAKTMAILRALPDMMFIQDLEGVYLDFYAPPESAPMFPPGVFLGKKMQDLFPSDFLEKIMPVFNNAKQSSQMQLLEYSLPADDGIHFYEARIARFEKDKILNIVRDITKHKQAELTIKDSEEKYRLITENVTDVIWVLNLNQKKYTYVSPSIYALRGYTVEEAMNEKFTDGMTSDSAQIVVEQIEYNQKKFIEDPETYTKKVIRTELQIYCRNGDLIWIETSTRFRYNADKEIEIVGLSRKIEERKKHEQKLLHRLKYEESISFCSSALLQRNKDALIKTMTYILLASDTSRVYIYENFLDNENKLSMRQTHEICAENITHKTNNQEFQHLVYEDEGFSRWKEILSQNKILSGNIVDFPESERRLLENQDIKSILVIPIRVNRRWYGFIGFDDIVQQRSWNEEDVRLLRTVAEMIGLYLENTENQSIIVQRNKQLAQLNATKDKFLSILAHDLKSPFASILGFSELMVKNLHKYNNEKVMKFVQAIYDSSKSAYMLVDNLLEWARSQSGKIEFNPEKFKLKTLVLEVIFLLENMATAKNISLSCEIDDETTVFADRNMINTVLRNLITNAIKFTNRNGAVTVSAILTGNENEIKVSDTGIGISKEILGKLFKINEKVTYPGTEQEKGTGLGLLLCHEFISRHNGKISVESELGEGSSFTFKLLVPDNQ